MDVPVKDQRTINLHTSQISHGWSKLTGLKDDILEVIVGYRPSMFNALVLDSSDVPLYRIHWYATKPTQLLLIPFSVMDPLGPRTYDMTTQVNNGVVSIHERGVTADLTNIELYTAAKIVWEIYGSQEGESLEPEEENVYNMPEDDDEGEDVS